MPSQRHSNLSSHKRRNSHPYIASQSSTLLSTQTRKRLKKVKSCQPDSIFKHSKTATVQTEPLSPAFLSHIEKSDKERKKKRRGHKSCELKTHMYSEDGISDQMTTSTNFMDDSQIMDVSSELLTKIPISNTATLAATESSIHVTLAKCSERDISKEKGLNTRTNREIARFREEAQRREAVLQELASSREELQRLTSMIECAKQREDNYKIKIETLENSLQIGSERNNQLNEIIRRQIVKKEGVVDAVTCTVCLEVYKDPHLLSCGHMGCRECLLQWFRSPTAIKNPPEGFDPSVDFSHYTKSCHVCRGIIIRRPVRAFFLRNVLEPLGLYQDNSQAPSTDIDPWAIMFPPEPTAYKIFDDSEDVFRCPMCLSEIEYGVCSGCDLEFSDSGNEYYDDDEFDLEVDLAVERLDDENTPPESSNVYSQSNRVNRSNHREENNDSLVLQSPAVRQDRHLSPDSTEIINRLHEELVNITRDGRQLDIGTEDGCSEDCYDEYSDGYDDSFIDDDEDNRSVDSYEDDLSQVNIEQSNFVKPDDTFNANEYESEEDLPILVNRRGRRLARVRSSGGSGDE
ncbi:uncharacterized protein L203_105080 [Cryptococcus depauperatus CBS 7841]|uniref:RING-type domain-containing protein n=1 Tax=Cryptococcus depauperatus CBS 7841 TaxID=1295531 RepID=A0AAJ8M2T2_9TREE